MQFDHRGNARDDQCRAGRAVGSVHADSGFRADGRAGRPEHERIGDRKALQGGWNICAWKGKKYSVSVYSTAKHSADEIAHKDGNVNQQPVTMAGRQGTEFHEQGSDRNCDIVFQTSKGTVKVQVIGPISDDVPIAPCPTLANISKRFRASEFFDMGHMLEGQFKLQATGDDNSIEKIIADHVTSVKNMREVMAISLARLSGQYYTNASTLKGIIDQNPAKK